MMDNQIATISKETDYIDFWQQWQQYKDYLYYCCLKWMNGNPSDAEDALSRAMLKAWQKAQNLAGKIASFKAWLTKLTQNLCVDIHRERSKNPNSVENIEVIGHQQELFYFEDNPIHTLEADEKRMAIRRAIDNLPTRLRQTFILHFYRELSHQDIVEEQGISYQNVCKRISQARAVLQEELRGYFIGEDDTDTELSVSSKGIESVKEEVVVSVAVEEVKESQENSQENLEEKNHRSGGFDLGLSSLGIRQILDLGQFERKFGCWGNSSVVVLLIKEQHFVGKIAGKIQLPSRAPPLDSSG